jgi:hypothetical protein
MERKGKMNDVGPVKAELSIRIWPVIAMGL